MPMSMQSVKEDLSAIYEEYSGELYACAVAITGRSELAEDAIHDAFRRMLNLGQAPGCWKAYVFRSVRNAAVDVMRRQGRTVELDAASIFDPSPAVTETVERVDFMGHVADALRRLTADERETIIQHIYADLTFREISDLREAPMGTVASWYRRGMENLRRLLDKHVETNLERGDGRA